MNQDTIDQLNELATAYYNLVWRDKPSAYLDTALNNLELIIEELSTKLAKDLANG